MGQRPSPEPMRSLGGKSIRGRSGSQISPPADPQVDLRHAIPARHSSTAKGPSGHTDDTTPPSRI